MRTFIGIPVPDKCKEILNQMQQALRCHKADIRWVSIHSVHLTLKFLGEVDPVIVPQLATLLQSECRALPSIFLRLHGLGCFPNPSNPRVIWCGIEGDMKTLLQIQRLVGATCQKYGFASGDSDYAPHLTLGRVMSKRNLKPLMDCIKIGMDLESSFCAEYFNIYRSDLRPQGAIHTVLNTITLNP
jgi:2'-5' RNA ligase